MAKLLCVMLIIAIFNASALCKPLDNEIDAAGVEKQVANSEGPRSGHRIWKRFVNPVFTFGTFPDSGIGKMRTKRQADEECEKLQLCKLHARSRYNFVSAFELYFVNKENARLWDHRARSLADCERQYSCHYRR